MKQIFALMLVMVLVQSCTQKTPTLKSPCVSVNNGVTEDPCGPRTPINKWLNTPAKA